MTTATTCPQLSIGIVAYGITPQKVMVRVPNERGRWLLTDWCVIAVPCTNCGAIVGEPCHNGKDAALRRYGTGTHYVRRNDASKRFGRAGYQTFAPHKLRLREEDMACDITEAR